MADPAPGAPAVWFLRRLPGKPRHKARSNRIRTAAMSAKPEACSQGALRRSGTIRQIRDERPGTKVHSDERWLGSRADSLVKVSKRAPASSFGPATQVHRRQSK